MNDSISLITLALQAVTSRMLTLFALLMTFALFCWAMWMGTALSLYVAGSFAVLGFLPVLIKGDGRVRKEEG